MDEPGKLVVRHAKIPVVRATVCCTGRRAAAPVAHTSTRARRRDHRPPPRRSQPGPREVRIKVKYNGICGSDLEAYRGSRKPEFMSCPMRLGHEVSGVIDVVGSSVVGLVPGQKVATRYVWGALAGERRRPRSPVVPHALSRGAR